MAQRFYAIVKLDDYNTTHSTGGVVVHVRYDEPDCQYGVDTPYAIPEGCKRIECDNENCKPGWIYTDKTHQFVDSNVSSN